MAGSVVLTSSQVSAMPQFAREYGLRCSACHVHIPKLNAYGEQFAANGYRLPGVEKRRTLPLTLWASEIGQLRSSAPNDPKAVLNRLKIVSAGPLGSSGGYMFEWNPGNRDFAPDGSTKESNGRLEDVFVFFGFGGNLTAWLGQFRSMSQIDESGKVFLTDPLVFGKAVPGNDALSGFAPSGRSPAIRLSKQWPDSQGSFEGTYLSGTLAFSGSFAMPVDSAGGSWEVGRSKGLLLEGFRRRGLESCGVQVFAGDNDRLIVGLLGQKNVGPYHWEAGISRARWSQGKEWRSSLSLAWIPSDMFAAALRMDRTHAPGQPPTFVPLLSYVSPLGGLTSRFILEGRLREHESPTWMLEWRVLY